MEQKLHTITPNARDVRVFHSRIHWRGYCAAHISPFHYAPIARPEDRAFHVELRGIAVKRGHQVGPVKILQ